MVAYSLPHSYHERRYSGKFGYDRMQQRTRKITIIKKTSLRTFKVKLLTRVCTLQKACFVACEVQCLHHELNNGVKCK